MHLTTGEIHTIREALVDAEAWAFTFDHADEPQTEARSALHAKVTTALENLTLPVEITA